MEKYVANGRSTRGASQKNDVAVDFRSGERHARPAAKSNPAKNKPKAKVKGD
jgi:hypothetical protein